MNKQVTLYENEYQHIHLVVLKGVNVNKNLENGSVFQRRCNVTKRGGFLFIDQ